MDFSKWQRAVEDLAKTRSSNDLSGEMASLFNKIYPDGPHVSASGDTFAVGHFADPDAMLADPYEAAGAAVAARHAAADRFVDGFRIHAAATIAYVNSRPYGAI